MWYSDIWRRTVGRGQLMWVIAPLNKNDNNKKNVVTQICNGPQLVPVLLQPIIHITISHSAVSIIPLLFSFSMPLLEYG